MITQNFSSIVFAVSEELRNKQTETRTDRLTVPELLLLLSRNEEIPNLFLSLEGVSAGVLLVQSEITSTASLSLVPQFD